ncbi:MAG: tetratricopeptide repeat protein [Clostridiales bacterium]|jgi:tetratricopeptide (TPR) repeat protein|nr:tetratricopeptide repeat protein [Clostridiales bacterium]
MQVIFLLIPLALLVWQRGNLLSAAARFVYARGKSEGWKTLFALAAKIGGMNFNNRMLHAYLLLKDGDADEANKKFALLSMERLTKEQRLRLKGSYALVYWKRGEVDTAIEMLEEVVDAAPSTTTYGSLGYMYAYNGNLSRALEFNEKAYEYNSTNAIIVDNLAFTYYKTGEYTKAKEYYEKLLELNPTFPEAYYGYGRLLVELGEREQGLAMVRRALSANFSFLTMTGRQEINAYLDSFSEEL